MSSIRPSDLNSGRLSLKERFNLQRFTRGEKASSEPIVLSHRRIFILPTRVGFFGGFTLMVMLLASIIYNNNPGFILTFLLGSVCVVSILHNFRSLTGLSVSLDPAEPVFAGETANCRVRVDNPSNQDRLNLEVARKGQTPVFDSVAARAATIFTLPLPTQRRGWLNPGPIVVSSRYPLGLFRAWSPLNFSRSVLVYPKPASTALAPQASEAGRGQSRHRFVDCEDFSGLKEYAAGDSLRRIHWKAYAKGHGLVVKEFSGEQIADLWFDLAKTPGASLEDRISLLCRWIIDAERSGLRYALRLSNHLEKPGSGDHHLRACLKALALH